MFNQFSSPSACPQSEYCFFQSQQVSAPAMMMDTVRKSSSTSMTAQQQLPAIEQINHFKPIYHDQKGIFNQENSSGRQGIQRNQKSSIQKVGIKSLKRRIFDLQRKIQDLERENSQLKKLQSGCENCYKRRQLDYYRIQRCEEMMLEQIHLKDDSFSACPLNRSSDSIQFEKIDLHTPLIRSEEMEEKMWVFLGLILISMGSKVIDCDGTFTTFKVLKNSVDQIRKQVGKSEKKVSLDIFCSKQEIKSQKFIDGLNYDPFYYDHEDHTQKTFLLDHIKLQSVDYHDLFYDFRYNYSINYQALLTILEYAKDYCSIA